MKNSREHSDLESLMKRYAMSGLDFWENDVSSGEQQRARRCLGQDVIAEIEEDVNEVVYSRSNRHNPHLVRYIPMPGPVRNVDHAFFRPIRTYPSKDIVKTSFSLFLIVTQREETGDQSGGISEVPPRPLRKKDMCLAFRWELPEEGSNTHGYAHIQFCRNMAKNGPDHRGIPDWMPESYPAIPIGTSDPVKMFLSLAMSVHGIDLKNDPATLGLGRILVNAFKNEPSQALKFQKLARETSGVAVS